MVEALSSNPRTAPYKNKVVEKNIFLLRKKINKGIQNI
jgi:hypothetical protein